MLRVWLLLCLFTLCWFVPAAYIHIAFASTDPIIVSMWVESFHVGGFTPMENKIDIGNNITGITQKLSELLLILVVAGALLGGSYAVFKMVTSGEKGIGEGKMMLEKIIKGILISFTAYTIVKLLSFALSKVFGQ